MQTSYKIILACGLAIISFSSVSGQDCATQIIPPVLSEAARASMEEKRAAAAADYEKAPKTTSWTCSFVTFDSNTSLHKE